MDSKEEFKCSLCGRNISTRHRQMHHLIPKSRKGRVIIALCRSCHSKIHQTFTNKELEKQFHSIEELRSHPEIQKWVRFIRKQKSETVAMRPYRKKQ